MSNQKPENSSAGTTGNSNSKRLTWVVAVILMVGIAVFFISQKTTQEATDNTVKVNIVTWPGFGPAYLAKKKGYFKDEGIDVEIAIQENTQARRAALMSGEIDLIGITFETVVLANMKGVPMQAIGITDISNGGDGIVAGPEINSIADLKGKRVAFPEGQPSHLFLLTELDKSGLMASDIQPVLTDDAGRAGEIFASGNSDAAVTWEPWLSTVVEAGKGKILVSSEGAKDILIGVFAANRNRTTSSAPKLQAFIRGWYRALEDFKAHPEESVALVAGDFGIPKDEFSAILTGLRFIEKDEAVELLGSRGAVGRFSEVAEYNAKLWAQAGVAKSNDLSVGDMYSSIAIAP